MAYTSILCYDTQFQLVAGESEAEVTTHMTLTQLHLYHTFVSGNNFSTCRQSHKSVTRSKIYTYPAAGATEEFFSLSLASLDSALTSFSSLKQNNTIHICGDIINAIVCSNGYVGFFQQIIGREYCTDQDLKFSDHKEATSFTSQRQYSRCMDMISFTFQRQYNTG